MNIVLVIILGAVFLALVIGGFKSLVKAASLRAEAQKEGQQLDEAEPLYRWGGRASLFVAFLVTIIVVDGFIVDIPNPFSGPKVGNEMPTMESPAQRVIKPEINVPDGRATMKDAAEEHQKKLESFENE